MESRKKGKEKYRNSKHTGKSPPLNLANVLIVMNGIRISICAPFNHTPPTQLPEMHLHFTKNTHFMCLIVLFYSRSPSIVPFICYLFAVMTTKKKYTNQIRCVECFHFTYLSVQYSKCMGLFVCHRISFHSFLCHFNRMPHRKCTLVSCVLFFP